MTPFPPNSLPLMVRRPRRALLTYFGCGIVCCMVLNVNSFFFGGVSDWKRRRNCDNFSCQKLCCVLTLNFLLLKLLFLWTSRQKRVCLDVYHFLNTDIRRRLFGKNLQKPVMRQAVRLSWRLIFHPLRSSRSELDVVLRTWACNSILSSLSLLLGGQPSGPGPPHAEGGFYFGFSI